MTEITDAHREVADTIFENPPIVKLNRRRMAEVPLLCDMYLDWLNRKWTVPDSVTRKPELTNSDIVSFADDGKVWRGDELQGTITITNAGVWQFHRHSKKDVFAVPGFYPSYAIAEVGVRAYLEHEDAPEIGHPHHDGS